MQIIILIRRLMEQPVMAVLGTLGCAVAAKSGTPSVSLAYLGAVATFALTRVLAASIARMRHHDRRHTATGRHS